MDKLDASATRLLEQELRPIPIDSHPLIQEFPADMDVSGAMHNRVEARFKDASQPLAIRQIRGKYVNFQPLKGSIMAVGSAHAGHFESSFQSLSGYVIAEQSVGSRNQ
jgi:hypothetical protein